MSTRDVFYIDALEEIRQKLMQELPKNANISKIEFEGPFLVLYSKNIEQFMENGGIIKHLAKTLRKRIVIRSDPSVRKKIDEATQLIYQIVPEDAQITNLHFDETLGEVTIEAKKPGLVIGKNGVTLREIARVVSWRPNVIRTPPIESKTIASIRQILQNEVPARKKSLVRIGRRIHRPRLYEDELVRITALGGCGEVGRSSMLVQTAESNILIDIGVNVGSSSPSEVFPRLNAPEFDIENLDAVVITHAHLDHCGFLPYLYKYGYRGPVYLNDATLSLMVLLQNDYLQVAENEGRVLPYSYRDIKTEIIHAIPRRYGEVTDIANDIKLTLTPAGHILGSSIVHLHIGEGDYNIAFTGDFKFKKSRLLDPANYKFARLETLVMETTYGAPTDIVPPRRETERRLIQIINRTLKRGGKVLIPTLAVGRAQEIMVVLNRYLKSKHLIETPIYLDGLISEATAIHTCHPEYLSQEIQDRIFNMGDNPFLDEHFISIENRSRRDEVLESGPTIILATSGMLTGGSSVEYFSELCEDEKNTIIFVSYQAPGTLGARISSGAKEIHQVKGGKMTVKKVNMEVHTLQGFSGHSDRNELMQYLLKITPQPENVVLVHGNLQKSLSFANSVQKHFRKMKVHVPKILESLRLL